MLPVDIKRNKNSFVEAREKDMAVTEMWSKSLDDLFM